MDQLAFDFRRIKLPTYFFLLYILLIPFESIIATHIFVMVSYATIAAVVTSLFVLIYLIFRPKLLRLTKTAFPWVAFFLWSGLSIYWSVDRGRSLYDFTYISKHVFFLLIISSYPFNFSEKRIIRHAIILSGILLSATIFFTTFQIRGVSGLVRATIANGYYKADPNHIATTLLLPISFLVVDFVESRKFSVLDLISSVILFSTIVYTGSRGSFVAFLAIAVYLILLYYKEQKSRKIILILVFSLAVISFTISFLQPDLFARYIKITNLDRYSSHRTLIWNEAFKLIKDKPLAGYGFGTLKIIPSAISNYKTAHNIFIQAFVEGGAIAFCLMLIACIPLILVKPISQFGRAAKAGVIGVLVSSLFLYTFNYDYFWLAIIIAEISNRNIEFLPEKKAEPEIKQAKLKPIIDIG